MRKNILSQSVAIFFISLLFLSIVVVKVSAKEKAVEESRGYTSDFDKELLSIKQIKIILLKFIDFINVGGCVYEEKSEC